VALLQEMTCNLRHPMSLRRPVSPGNVAWIDDKRYSLTNWFTNFVQSRDIQVTKEPYRCAKQLSITGRCHVNWWRALFPHELSHGPRAVVRLPLQSCLSSGPFWRQSWPIPSSCSWWMFVFVWAYMLCEYLSGVNHISCTCIKICTHMCICMWIYLKMCWIYLKMCSGFD